MSNILTETQRVQSQAYKDLLAYVVTNTISGEIMAVNNYTTMVPLIDDVDEKIHVVKQARDEGGHVNALSKLAAHVDFPTMKGMVEPQWKEIGRFVKERAREGDLTACIIAQDIMVETFATVAYTALQRNTDKHTRSLAASIYLEEVAHLQHGVDQIHRMLDNDAEDVHRAFEMAHKAVMPAMMSMVNYNCFSLCDQLKIKCSTVSLGVIEQDLDQLRIDAIDTYMEKIDRIGLDPNRVAPLFSSLVDDDPSKWQPKNKDDISGISCCH
ncbi:long-chain fatty aldehyde decarbonylase [Enterovibrio makurazakiensis]|uniref:Long-chain fatty aldehyde decarbonylase n=1 Tax=Enterovibrio gelatinilyticus TaxID=2899819 RepID=A0ABT5R385_9GAMM|nr:ferritin-like domain-containing protein [Enterovibrio sp. ZSDZ42]MDD1794231.1 long-chain fatty aldehyde decarbonylase [Enterovibrio sp. ZSDZ42]